MSDGSGSRHIWGKNHHLILYGSPRKAGQACLPVAADHNRYETTGQKDVACGTKKSGRCQFLKKSGRMMLFRFMVVTDNLNLLYGHQDATSTFIDHLFKFINGRFDAVRGIDHLNENR